MQAYMPAWRIDVAAEATAATLYQTYTNVELLQKSRLEAEVAASARKALQVLLVNENLTRKRAREQESLRGWLTYARN